MRFLVTGSDGHVGRVLTPMLVVAGHRVTGLDAADFFRLRRFRISRVKEGCASGTFDARLPPRPAAA